MTLPLGWSMAVIHQL
uniref:Uncharacterized protein n=1 Tax=Arundo donax TaxID=35708 RepID=A0A0A9CHH5_ARUDO